MKKIFFVILISLLTAEFSFAGFEIVKPIKTNKTSFAVIIDKNTYDKTKDAVIAYRDAVEKDGLATYIVILSNENPEAIKKIIEDLYSKKPCLEGVVFVGDVPIPMIRDAQHMTSAFKMDQERDWTESSIPSDKYYEDFDLKFKFVKKDSAHALYYYYSLLGESQQKITPEIYSGRIKAPVDNEQKYKLVSDYLYKAVKAKASEEVFDNALVFSGHGYGSESITNILDEFVSLREQFPNLYKNGNVLKYLRYNMSRDMKGILMHELSNKKLDFALFHAHGAPDVQYILDDPASSNIESNVSWTQRFLRSKIRSAKDRKQNIEEAKKYYKKEYDIPESWFKNTFQDSLIKADSLYGYNLDIHSEDLSLFQPEAKFLIYDECFNGSFHIENSISGRYIFQKGNTIAAFANSVNVLQDLWTDEFLGLLNNGIRIGQLHKVKAQYLENHIIGDPTFHFKNTSNIDLVNMIDSKDVKVWKKLINNSSSELRSLAVKKLHQLLGQKFENDLVSIYKKEDSFGVRLEAFACLAADKSESFKNLLPTTMNDPYNFIRIKSGLYMGEIAENKYIPLLIDHMINDECARVSFSAKNSLNFFNQDTVQSYLKAALKDVPEYFIDKKNSEALITASNRNKEWLFNDLLKTIWDSKAKPTKRKNQLRTFRNYNFDQGIPELIKFSLSKEQPEDLRIVALEALGWSYYNHQSGEIIKATDKLISGSESEAIKNEAVKTKNRITYGPNVSLTP